jgi:hypothetical protein
MDASEESLNELAERIKISGPEDLDTEFVSQPNDYYHVSTRHAIAVSLRDQAKNNLDITEAQLYLSFKRNSEKLTEANLKAMVEADDIRGEFLDLYMQAKLLADKWLALRDSFSQKGHALRELAELYKLNYFGERSVSASERMEAEDRVRSRATNNDH